MGLDPPYCCAYAYRDRQMATKANKKLERKMKELVMQSEDERRHADQYKEQVRRVNLAYSIYCIL